VSLVSRIYSNPSQAKAAFDVTASASANAKAFHKAFSRQPESPMTAKERSRVESDIASVVQRLANTLRPGQTVERTRRDINEARLSLRRLLKFLQKRSSLPVRAGAAHD
jgi:hypothetical protein